MATNISQLMTGLLIAVSLSGCLEGEDGKDGINGTDGTGSTPVLLKTSMEGDFDTGNVRYKARERYVFGVSDWRGIFGTPGA